MRLKADIYQRLDNLRKTDKGKVTFNWNDVEYKDKTKVEVDSMKINVERIKFEGHGLTNKGIHIANSCNITTKRNGTKIAKENPKYKRLLELSKEENFSGTCKIVGEWEVEVDKVIK